MKKSLPFIIYFIFIVGYGQNKKGLLDKKGLYPIESLCDLDRGNNPFNIDDFTELQSNSYVQKTLSQTSKSKRSILSKQQEYTLRLDRVVSVVFSVDDLSSKYESTYDANRKTTLFINYLWDAATQSFAPSSKTEYAYDINENQTLYIGYTWVRATQSFVPSSKNEYTYDVNGHLTLIIGYTWDTETQSFVPSSKNEFTYDVNGKQTLYIYYRWNTATQSFRPSFKREYTYDVNGHLTLIIGYTWDTETQSFVPSYKNESSYDINGHLALIIQNTWNTETQSFVPSSKYEHTYDANGNRTLYTLYKWHPSLGDYKPSFKQEYSIILDNTTNLVIMGTTFKYDTNFNKWNELVGEEYKSYWYYTKTSALSTEEFNSSLFAIYPNPTSDYLNIKTADELSNLQLEMFDISGKRVLYQPINSKESIDIQNLTPSIYLYHITDGESLLKSGKIIKE
jgi:hypothetical protein